MIRSSIVSIQKWNSVEMNGTLHETDGRLCLDTRIYSLDTIKKAAYRLAARVSIVINPTAGTEVVVVFNFKNDDHRQIVAAFCDELLDQDLRETIKRETTPVRNLILAHAFSRTSLVEQE